MDESAAPREAQLLGQQPEVDNLDPDIEPEPTADQSGDTPGLADDEPGGGDSDPELGNTLIEPENS